MVDQESALSLSKFHGPKQVGQPVLGGYGLKYWKYVGFHQSTAVPRISPVASANLHAEQNKLWYPSAVSEFIHIHSETGSEDAEFQSVRKVKGSHC